MTEMSAAEAAVVARFKNAKPAPESWGHAHHWIGTHDHGPVCSVCGIAKPEGGDDGLRERVRELAEDLESFVAARGRPATGTYDDGLNRAQAAIAADLRRALDGPERQDRGRC